MRSKEQPPEPEDDLAFVRRLETAQYVWYGQPEHWIGARKGDDGDVPAGISRGDHRRVVEMARHLVNVREALK